MVKSLQKRISGISQRDVDEAVAMGRCRDRRAVAAKTERLRRDVADGQLSNERRASGPAKHDDTLICKGTTKMERYERTENEKKLQNQINMLESQYQNQNMPQDVSEWLQQAKATLQDADDSRPQKPLTLQNTIGGGNPSSGVTTGGGAYMMRGPSDPKDFKSLFGSVGNTWQGTGTHDNFFAAVFSGRHDPRLIKAGMTESVPSDGGFLVPHEHFRDIHNAALESEVVMPRANVIPMMSNEITLPAMSIGSHNSSLYGGFSASWTAEAGELTEANPKTRSVLLAAKKLTGFLRFSSELNADSAGGMGQIIQICGAGIAHYRDSAFLTGTGAGQPLGILNATATITVDKEQDQGAATITYANLTSMLSRLYPGSFNRATWVVHPSTLPELLALTINVGDGGSHYPVLSESSGSMRMLSRPVVVSEQAETLGTKGDVMLCDFSQYAIGLRADLRIDLSPHLYFQTDQIAARLITRLDGAPLWNEALTLKDGSTTVSPFIVLQTRD